ncbi:hypothetical protein J2T13_000869 [Paenibacillus sp. DS2015]|uniref:hypothetical protein n=1 Tax=Paenibacillus sp. DS2015 TaxID=3373917 RepID=UPI003D23967F
MAHKVINRFKDNDEGGTIYSVGESYPKGNSKPTKKRIEELSKVHSEYNVAFIEEVKVQQKE